MPVSKTILTEDTFPQWLHERFRSFIFQDEWETLTEADQLFWQHEAAAVRRAVARKGFKKESLNHAGI